MSGARRRSARGRGWIAAAVAAAMVVSITCVAALSAGTSTTVQVGSKAFPESWILGEALTQLARASGAEVTHRSNLGGTEIVFAALEAGSLDVYPEYTGTIAEVILKTPAPTVSAMREALAARGIGVSDPLGFNDGYALAVTRATATGKGLRTLSDLARHPELRFGLTHEFLGRRDGFEGLARHYGLRPTSVLGIQHELAYGALTDGRIDVTDIYTTDAQIQRLSLVVLEDDRAFFPRYDAVLLYRRDLERRAPRAWEAMRRLLGTIDEARMIRANARVVLEQAPFAVAAEELVADLGGVVAAPRESRATAIARSTLQHLRLVAVSLAAAIVIGIPLGVVATRAPWLAAVTLSLSGLVQTVPSLALLAFLIPIFGVGPVPALIALFLYSLLPIVRNTYVGLTTIAPSLDESARALGLTARTRLFRVDLPLASPAIMAGIKISAVLNVGTATLAALVGAGGLGDPILSGIQLRRHDLILQGAIPAALLAIIVQWLFDRLDRWIIPRGLGPPAS